jgi:uncharacterized protein YndB with AHSA1/START domain
MPEHADIRFDFPVLAPVSAVYAAVSSAQGLNAWWTLTAEGEPRAGSSYSLHFGPAYEWRAEVERVTPDREIVFRMTDASADWLDSRVSISLAQRDAHTWVQFAHVGWTETSDHFRVTAFCWAMYLRLLRRYVESGEIIPYDQRLDV